MFIIAGIAKKSHRAAYEKLTSTPPFKIPKNWLWVQIDSISESINVGIVIRPKRYYTSKDEGTPAFRNCNIQGGSIDDSEWVYLKATAAKENPRSVVRYGDVLIARSGNAGNCCVVPKTYSGYGAIDVIIARPLLKFVSPDFLAVNLCAASTQTMLTSISRGVALSHLGVTTISSLPMPLPPLTEQKRIVAKVKELFAIANSLGAAADGLENAAKRLDKKILDLAIRGRLVPQDPNDEPASELVKRIAASHKSPCKNQSEPIHPPFAIPQSWEWVRLGNITTFLHRGKSPTYVPHSDCPMFAQKCNQWDGIHLEKCKFCDEAKYKTFQDEYHLRDYDIVVNSTGTGTLGRVGIFHDCELVKLGYLSIVPDSHVTVVRTSLHDLSQYIYHYLCTKFCWEWMNNNADGSTKQKELYTSTLASLLIPIPPLAEQRRIASAIPLLLNNCNQLKQQPTM